MDLTARIDFLKERGYDDALVAAIVGATPTDVATQRRERVATVPLSDVYVAANLDESQTVQLDGAPDVWLLSFDGHSVDVGDGIAADASASDVRVMLETLPNIDPGDVIVQGANGGPWTVYFAGQYAGVDVPLMEVGGPVLDTVIELRVDATGGTFRYRAIVGNNVADIPYNISASDLQAIFRPAAYYWQDMVVTGGPGGPGGSTPYILTIPGGGGTPGGDASESIGVDNTTGGSGVSATIDQRGGPVSGSVTANDPTPGDAELPYHWRGAIRAYKQAGRAYVTGMPFVIDAPDESIPLLRFPPGWAPPYDLFPDGLVHPVTLEDLGGDFSPGYAQLVYGDTNDDWILNAVWTPSQTDLTANSGWVKFDGLSWPLAR